MRANVLVSLLVVVAAAVTARAAEKRAFEIADYYRTAFVGAPEISPDGLRVAVAVTRYEIEKGESWSEIWMMGSHGSNSRQMTQGRHHDSWLGGGEPPWDVERFLRNRVFDEGDTLGGPPSEGAGSD
jgi:hypothetical protein